LQRVASTSDGKELGRSVSNPCYLQSTQGEVAGHCTPSHRSAFLAPTQAPTQRTLHLAARCSAGGRGRVGQRDLDVCKTREPVGEGVRPQVHVVSHGPVDGRVTHETLEFDRGNIRLSQTRAEGGSMATLTIPTSGAAT
jgi:hypothetical protein